MIVKVQWTEKGTENRLEIYDIEAKTVQTEINGVLNKEVRKHEHDLTSLMQVPWGKVVYMSDSTFPKEKVENE